MQKFQVEIMSVDKIVKRLQEEGAGATVIRYQKASFVNKVVDLNYNIYTIVTAEKPSVGGSRQKDGPPPEPQTGDGYKGVF